MTREEREQFEALQAENQQLRDAATEREGTDAEAAAAAAAAPAADPEPIELDAHRTAVNASAADARRDERAANAAHVTAVEQTCRLAGCPDRAIGFLKKGTSIEDVRAALCDADAAADEGVQVDGARPGAGTGVAAPTVVIDREGIFASRAAASRPTSAETRARSENAIGPNAQS